MRTDKNTIGYKLSKIRFELNMNKKRLAEIIGVSLPTITRYESGGRIPDYNFLVSLVEKCNVSPDYLFGRSEEVFHKKSEEIHVS